MLGGRQTLPHTQIFISRFLEAAESTLLCAAAYLVEFDEAADARISARSVAILKRKNLQMTPRTRKEAVVIQVGLCHGGASGPRVNAISSD